MSTARTTHPVLAALAAALLLVTVGCSASSSGLAVGPSTSATGLASTRSSNDPLSSAPASPTRAGTPSNVASATASAPSEATPSADVSQPPLPPPSTPTGTPAPCPVNDLTAAWAGEPQDCLEPEVLSHLFFPERSFTTDLTDTYTQDVVFIQLRLRDLGQSVTVDGRYGPKTADAVRAYQRSHGLAVDGVVGLQTWTSLFHLGRG